ncbi:MAG: phosphoglycerate dehydrogenase [Cytophagales bacterium]
MENQKKYFVFDFDSTFTKVEALDVLCEISVPSDRRAEVLAEIKRITDLGMEGKISLIESLTSRVSLLGAHKSHLDILVEKLKSKVSDSVVRNKKFFEENAENIYILSNGFLEFIEPVVTPYGIKKEHILANTFIYNAEGKIVGLDTNNELCQNRGKAKKIQALNLDGEIFVVGDGWTDYEIKLEGVASRFYAFTENVSRDAVTKNADHIAPSIDEFLYHSGLPAAVSYPKNRINVLLLENVHPDAVRLFREEGYNVEFVKGAMDEDELCEKIKNVTILGIRSKTMVTQKVLDHANKLLVVGAFCIGTNQIDLKYCQKKGIAVFNAPYSNTRSVVELAIGEMIMLMRNIPEKSNQMHQGKWDKSATNCKEIRGKKLGLVGYGNIGTQLSVLAENLGMEVYYYDVVEKLALGNAKKCNSLHELLRISDVVSLHVDGRANNKNLIGDDEFAVMKDGVIFLNLARGPVVDIDAFVKHHQSGKIRGAAFDVYPYEPKTNDEEFKSPLRGLKNVILSPHIGGSTEEAQANIGNFVPNKIIQYINTGSTYGSVNFPEIQLPEFKNAHRLMHVHGNVPGIMAKINQLLANNNVNILGQYLKTNEAIGYVITDIDTVHDKELEKEMKELSETIRFRILY